MDRALALTSLLSLLAIACGGGNTNGPDDVPDIATPGDMAGAVVDLTGADLTGVILDMTGEDLIGQDLTGITVDAAGAKQPVGHTCSSAADCSGANPFCRASLGGIAIPGNYCSNHGCDLDGDCGAGGFCFDPGPQGVCFGSCSLANQCQGINPNNRCFFWDGLHEACLPSQVSECDPTATGSCGANLCSRFGLDNVGFCMTACSFGAACPVDEQGHDQVCNFVNGRVDGNGHLTGDVHAALACVYRSGSSTAGDACGDIGDCVSGYQCNVHLQGGSGLTCQKLCRNGNSTDCDNTGGVCQDAFLLGKSNLWVSGAIGLCLRVAKAAVGHTCSSAADCDGPNARCTTAFGGVSPPGGYCENSPCTSDADCGIGGFCATSEGRCLGECAGAGECQTVNPNNRCFGWDDYHFACLPEQFSECDPTVPNACGNPGFCLRSGLDDVGVCLSTCSYTNQTCPDDSQGNPQRCYLINMRVDGNGTPTTDVSAGMACIAPTGDVLAGAACGYGTDCAAGLGCDFFGVGGKGSVCAKMCRNGTPADCNGTGGACQDAYLLGASGAWVTGAVGLCL